MALSLIIIAIIVFLIAYASYGAWLCKKWGIDPSRKTPAFTKNDGVDYVPAKSPVLLGHHFASIAGAGPIVGPIAAAMFGWLPVFLWIIVGSIFFGGVHDFGALFASIRHDGKSLGNIIEDNMGQSGKKLFSIFAWLTLLLVEAAFVNVVAGTFVATPQVATTSILFIVIAIIFGFAVNRKGLGLLPATIGGILLIILSIWLGNKLPIVLSLNAWIVIVLAYIFIASTAPVWILLQPRDYLNSYLLYAMLAGAVLGLVLYRPGIAAPAVVGFNVNGSFLFPILFVTVACGAISGFHSLVSSGTTAKQISNEKDAKLVGYGSMLIEGILAVVALITATYIGADKISSLGGATNIFADGVGTFMTSFGISKSVGTTFIALSISAFALTSLDTATRLGRFIFQEYFEDKTKEVQTNILTNRFVATGITVVLGGLLAISDYKKVWPIFGSANQLLAALALLAVAVWLKKEGKNNKMVTIPMTFMIVVTLAALVLLVKANISTGNYILVFFGVVLFILALVFIKQSYKVLTKKESSIQ